MLAARSAEYRLQKSALLMFKVRSTSTPSYLRRLIQDQEHGHNLRSTTSHYDAVSTFHDNNICETRIGSLELTTENR